MQKRMNIQASSLVILLSIFTILVQFTSYYFFEAFYIIWGVSCLISVVCCHILLEQTVTYESCFHFSLLTVFVSLVVIIVSYFGKVEYFMPYSGIMLGIAIINWLIPMLHCSLRYMLDNNGRLEEYNSFYRNISILFLTFYFVAIFYDCFARNSFPWAYPTTSDSYNFLPFGIISAQIEDYLYSYIPLKNILVYLSYRIFAFLPYGFYITLLLRRQERLPRLMALFVLPFLIEVLQFFLIPAKCDIDDLIYAFIGGIIGSLFFYLTNIIFRAVSGKDFLTRENDYRFSNNKLHF